MITSHMVLTVIESTRYWYRYQNLALSYDREHFSNTDLSDLRIVGTWDIIKLVTYFEVDMECY